MSTPRAMPETHALLGRVVVALAPEVAAKLLSKATEELRALRASHVGMSEAEALDILEERWHEERLAEALEGDQSGNGTEGTARRREVASQDLAWRTVEELRVLAGEHPTEWFLRGLFGAGVVTVIGAPAKVGKTTFMGAVLGALERGFDVAGIEGTASSAVYLSEEPAALLVSRCERFGVERAVFLAREDFDARRPFGEFLAAGVAECGRRGARILVVDTYARFSRLAEGKEQDSGATQAVMDCALEASAKGIAVVIVTHARKGSGKGLESIRGSTALVAAADIVIVLGRKPDNVHELTCSSRFAESPTEPLLLRLEGVNYRRLGDGASEDLEEAKSRILTALRSSGPLDREKLGARVKMRKQVFLAALSELQEAGLVATTGAGKRGDPYLFDLSVPGGSQAVPGTGEDGAAGGSAQPLTPEGGEAWNHHRSRGALEDTEGRSEPEPETTEAEGVERAEVVREEAAAEGDR